MNIKELMGIDVDNLIEKQHKGLKEYAINKLKEVIQLIEKEQYDKIDSLLQSSPAGDSDYINFNYDGCDRDIAEIIMDLENLKIKMK